MICKTIMCTIKKRQIMFTKSIFLTCGILIFCASATMAQFDKLKKKMEEKIETVSPASSGVLSEEEVGSGLREALTKGVEKGVDQLSKPDGYFGDLEIKIPLPEEAQEVETKLRNLGQGKKVDEAIESINRAAEDAANGAKDIFVLAIKSMTLTDAMSILRGDDDAATKFLDKATRAELVTKFKPIVKASLEKVGATKNWNAVFTSYNKIPFVTKVNPDLDEYATNKAIDGLFIQVAKEELSIRKNPAARVTDLLKKVFG
ncbi:MAG: hypothetical protein ACI837_003574 [Crocinitomicaceae bacterium]|jgi:hypothetical protein